MTEPATDPATRAPDRDISEALCQQVANAYQSRAPLRIKGGDTRGFYGRPVEGITLDMTEHSGIITYDPVELVVTVRAGTRLATLEAALAAEHQMLPFEPPSFGQASTIGGAVATGLSGPRRPWAGAARDFVLGSHVITQEGKLLRFGGEVMKNVAGYDVSRLMAGAQGTLGVLADISFKVLPRPAATDSLRLDDMGIEDALSSLSTLGREPLPITGAAWHQNTLFLRLEGGQSSVKATRERLGGEPLEDAFWTQLRDHQHDFFTLTSGQALWRASLPPHTAPLDIDVDETDIFYDWAGSQRWIKTHDGEALRRACQQAGGHATCFTPAAQGGADSPFTPLDPVVEKYHKRLKAELDTHGIFNPGRLYAGL
ncbi:glycolate oxidase subunit GlcE [Halomonas sp. PAMB 3264]|uniref:glycolate oxidase subunit GlcE n=1 Tax=Halomonas sp. PAMB 3264 TaxID=3075222 RepID=UPI0028991059|nr:glycolate oxidase subunit GlcE [Halomonas sp. PAMB 3264]WNL41655.1 glycolate oxidase subunit GlcE [Halomonas sp. PAMB 3264]